MASSAVVSSPKRPELKFYIAAALVGIVPLVAGHLPGDEPSRLEHLIWGYGLAGVPFLYILRHWSALPATRATLLRVLLLGAAIRLVLLSLPPMLSEDIWRYIWDGAVQWTGQSPYGHAPISAALDAVVSSPALAAVRAQVGHGHIPTIYPPAAQLAFAAVTGLTVQPVGLRLLMVGADLLTVASLWRWIEGRGGRPQAVALYAFAPVAILESAVGGHVDTLGVAGMVLAGALLVHDRPRRAGLALAVAIGTKLVPVLVLPALLRRAPRAVVASVVAVAVMGAPYLIGGRELLTGLRTYGQLWRANEGAFSLIHWPMTWIWPVDEAANLPVVLGALARALVGPPGASPASVWGNEAAFAFTKLVVALVLGLVWLWRTWRGGGLAEVLGPVLITLMLLSPVVHPWYLLWILPFAVLGISEGARWPWPLIAWTLLVPLAYLPRPDYLRAGTWQVQAWVPWVEYGPVWLGLAWVAWRARGHGPAIDADSGGRS